MPVAQSQDSRHAPGPRKRPELAERDPVASQCRRAQPPSRDIAQERIDNRFQRHRLLPFFPGNASGSPPGNHRRSVAVVTPSRLVDSVLDTEGSRSSAFATRAFAGSWRTERRPQQRPAAFAVLCASRGRSLFTSASN